MFSQLVLILYNQKREKKQNKQTKKAAFQPQEFREIRDSRNNLTEFPIKENSSCTESSTVVNLVNSQVRSQLCKILTQFNLTVQTIIKVIFMKRKLYTWSSSDGQHRNQIDYILCSQRWRSSIRSAKQDQELTVAQIMNCLLPNSDLKKVGETTRPFRYDLNQIPYDYTVEVRN